MAGVSDKTESGEGGMELKDLMRKRPSSRRQLALFFGALLVIAVLIFGIRYLVRARNYESTDDAFIESRIVQVSSKVAGHVLKIHVKDNQPVKQGDLLLEIDPRDFEVRLNQARAALHAAEAKARGAEAGLSLTRAATKGGVEEASSGVDVARSGVEVARAQVTVSRERALQAPAAIVAAQANAKQSQAQIVEAEAEARRAAADVERYKMLFEKDEISRQRLDQAIATSLKAEAQLSASRQRAAATEAQVAEAQASAATAQANVKQSEMQLKQSQARVGEASGRMTEAAAAPQQVEVSRAQAGNAAAEIELARATTEQAELQLSYTRIYAPSDGLVTRKAVEAGTFVQAGQALMAVVQNELWVVANFKETQLDKIRTGQPVEIRVDAFPGKVFNGHVDSIQRGSGARFSMMPPENATGNYVKVVQRVPVKIVFDQPPGPGFPLGPGMSVVPEVRVR